MFSQSIRILDLPSRFIYYNYCAFLSGDRKSREKIDCPRSNKENFEEDRVLSPIEEESESSTEQLADYTTNDPEDDSFYQTTHFRYKDCRSGFPKNYDRKRQDDLSFRSNVPNNVKNSSSGESTSGDERNTASGNCCFQMCDRSKLGNVFSLFEDIKIELLFHFYCFIFSFFSFFFSFFIKYYFKYKFLY